ncbi:MAG TPA: hypothetical protein VF701_20165 [Thermoanaerobaculia bacterium]
MAVCLFLAAPLVAASTFPAIPPLEGPGFPSPSSSEPFARALLRDVPPPELDTWLAEHSDQIPAVLRNLGSALMTGDAKLRAAIEEYLVSLARTRAAATPTAFTADHVRLLVSVQLVDPMRFMTDSSFRARVIPLLPRQLDTGIPVAVRRAALRELNGPIDLDFGAAERIAAAWKLIPRSSEERQVDWSGSLRAADDADGPIDTSVYSINSQFFEPAEARSFLTALRAAAPKRKIVVLGDEPIRKAASESGATFVESGPRAYTPWPRDPFLFARDSTGRVVVVNRPNLQPEREEDANMARALVQGLPDEFDAAWRKTQWTVAPVPFHNGHVLLTNDAAWISIHTVEIRALQILDRDRVPVETFGTAEGITTYLDAVKRAAKELEAVYGRAVRFVHPLETSPELMRRLGGGGGFDLDSILTLLPRADGQLTALVGDPALGRRLAANAEWSAARNTYDIRGDVAAAQSTRQMAALQTFLDTIASHLAASGMRVQRLPLIRVPASFVDGAPRDFLLTWNNVVLETTGNRRRAEGFGSRLENADLLARETFAAEGYELTLLPPLARSIILNGGYRCASNHLRPE